MTDAYSVNRKGQSPLNVRSCLSPAAALCLRPHPMPRAERKRSASNSQCSFNANAAASSQARCVCETSDRSHSITSLRWDHEANARNRMNHTRARFVSSRNRRHTASIDTGPCNSSSRVNSITVKPTTSEGRAGNGVLVTRRSALAARR